MQCAESFSSVALDCFVGYKSIRVSTDRMIIAGNNRAQASVLAALEHPVR
jgi:hypothetical protein